MKAKKQFGQNFLTAPNIAVGLANAAEVGKENILEIGPGKGILTKELLSRGAHVFAVEKDRDLVPYLQEKFSKEISSKELTLVEGDVRDVSGELVPAPYKLVANIPYYITGDIIRTFLTAVHQPSLIALLVQDEVGKRIAKDKKESILSISVKAYGTPRYVRKVPRSVFKPSPKVDSSIIVIQNISRNNFSRTDEEFFFKVVRAGFGSKRKQLIGNLKAFAPREKLLELFARCGLSEKIRAEDVVIESWLALARELKDY